jgi:hypothetical protein
MEIPLPAKHVQLVKIAVLVKPNRVPVLKLRSVRVSVLRTFGPRRVRATTPARAHVASLTLLPSRDVIFLLTTATVWPTTMEMLVPVQTVAARVPMEA